MSDTLIVDSWPVLEWFREREPASSRFREILDQAERGRGSLRMSHIIRGDIWCQVARRWSSDIYPLYRARLATLPIEVVSVDDALVDETAELKIQFSLSYADCFAAVSAMRHAAPVLAGDPDFLRLRDAGLIAAEWLGA